MTHVRTPGSVTGPVVITGANGHIGRALRHRLCDLPNEVRPVGRGDALEPAITRAGVVIHLAGTLWADHERSYEDANLGTVKRTVAAMTQDWPGRLVFLSYVGADASSDNAYLRTKGLAEQVVLAAGRAPVVIRSTFVYGPPSDPGPAALPFIGVGRHAVPIVGDGRQRWAPVFVGDVVEALTRVALDARVAPGIYGLGGPEVISADTFVAVLNRGHAVREVHVPPAVASGESDAVPGLSPTMVEVLAADSLPAEPLVADAVGLELTALHEVYK
jgi:nucleoside-diphosphate-sugar epimerase